MIRTVETAMKNKFTCLAAVFFMLSAGVAGAGAEEAGKAARITVAADPRVELMSVIFRLAGNKEYNTGAVPSYVEDVEKHFGPFKEHPAVKYAAELRETRGVSYDAVMAMGIHTTDTVTLGERVPFSPKPKTLDDRWTIEGARKFLVLARDFVKDTGFNEFYAAHKPLYEVSARRLQDLLDKNARLEWFDSFFGPAKAADFNVVLGMLNGGGSYGPRVALPDGREAIYSVIGVWKTDAQGTPVFPQGTVSTVVHEFTHSYTNPVVDRHVRKLEKAGRKIYPLVKKEMEGQAYGNWRTMMYESVNRACEQRYNAAYYGPDVIKRAEDYEISRSFYWVPGLGRVLAEYDAEPRKYKNLDDFFPKIASYFNAYAERAEGEINGYKEKTWAEADKKVKAMEAWREMGPKIVSMSPENGAADVSADLKVIKVVFDRPMGGGFSMVQLEGVERYPKVLAGYGYDGEKKVFSLPVEVQPGREYVLGLNSEDYINFKSEDGIPLFPVRYTFKTKP